MTLSTRRMLLAAALLGSLAGIVPFAGAALASSGAAKTDRSAASSCTTSGLDVWLDTQGNGAAGTIYYTLEITNLSGHACTLGGYPSVWAVTLKGQILGSGSSHLIGHAKSVTIGNGKTATAQLGIVDVGNFTKSACIPVLAAGLKVAPPGQSAARSVPYPFEACSKKGPQYLKIGVVK